jgi:hypothetical protein
MAVERRHTDISPNLILSVGVWRLLRRADLVKVPVVTRMRCKRDCRRIASAIVFRAPPDLSLLSLKR